MKPLHYEHVDELLYTKKLANGLTVFLLPKTHVHKTFAIFMTNYGSMDNTFIPLHGQEPIRVPDGIAHFLEHKLFEKKDRDVFADFAKLGASANAYTSFTKTAYLFTTTENVNENVRTLIDFVQEPYFSDASVEKEKGIITQEILMYQDQPDWVSYMQTIKNMYHELPIHIDIAGTVTSIQEITKEDLYTCYETFYHPHNMVLFIIGNFAVEELSALIEENQAQKQFSAQHEIKRFYPEEPSAVVTREKVMHMPVELPKVNVGIKARANFADRNDQLKTELIQQMLLDYFFSPSGAFYHNLLAEQLIDESFEYSTTVEKQFNFTMLGGNTLYPDKLVAKLRDLLLQMKTITITEEQFTLMKKKKIGDTLRAMNSLENIANQYVHYYFQDIDYFTIIPFIQNLTLHDLQTQLHAWIHEDRVTSLIITKE